MSTKPKESKRAKSPATRRISESVCDARVKPDEALATRPRLRWEATRLTGPDAATRAIEEEPLELITGDKRNWIGVIITPPAWALQESKEYVEPESHPYSMFIQGYGTSKVPHHITLAWGFDPNDYKKVEDFVAEARVSMKDIKFGKIFGKATGKPNEKKKPTFLVAVEIESPVLEKLKDELKVKFNVKNPYDVEGERFPLHLTMRMFTSVDRHAAHKLIGCVLIALLAVYALYIFFPPRTPLV